MEYLLASEMPSGTLTHFPCEKGGALTHLLLNPILGWYVTVQLHVHDWMVAGSNPLVGRVTSSWQY